jgi:drug/metabolite transporter (DMT)-like permease
MKFDVTFYSFLSGIFACLVSTSLKIAFNNNNSDQKLIQIGFICLSFVLNSLMWTVYTKSLSLSTSTLYASALNKFSNFICSALFGYILFEEKINFILWFFGLILLFMGILILSESTTTTIEQKEKKC